jgi:hypothetical protein
MEAIALAVFVELPTAALALAIYISTHIERIAAQQNSDRANKAEAGPR